MIETEKRKLDPYLQKAIADRWRQLTISPVHGHFVTKHRGGHPVKVFVAKDFGGTHVALLFKTSLNEDIDGAPTTYAPPKSSADTKPKDGLKPLDHIENATDGTKNPSDGKFFHDDASKNKFTWAGVMSAKAGRIDNRPFLQDANGNFPLFQAATSTTSQFYEPRTAMFDTTGHAVNPLVVPYAALSTSMRENGGIDLGDFGLAIRPSTGAFTGFLYGDAGGRDSTSVGECSTRMIHNLFGGGPATSEDICYLVFPDSAFGRLANATLIEPTVRDRLGALATRFDNVEDLIVKMLLPDYIDYATAVQFSRDLQAANGNSRPGIADVGLNDPAPVTARSDFRNVLTAMQRAGFHRRTP